MSLPLPPLLAMDLYLRATDKNGVRTDKLLYQRAGEPESDERTAPAVLSLPAFFSSVLARLDAKDEWNESAIHPSDLGAVLPLREDGSPEGCPRRVWLRVHGAKGNPMSDGQRLMLETSKWKHAILEGLLQDNADLLPEGWSIEAIEEHLDGGDGTLDILLRHQSPCPECRTAAGRTEGELECSTCDGMGAVIDRRLVVDIKTQNGSGFVFLKRDGQAKPSAVMQVRKYMMDWSADLGVVLYVDREGSLYMWQSPPFGRDDAAVEQAWARLEALCGDLPQYDDHSWDAGPYSGPPPLPPVLKKGLPTLPWCCQYHDRTGNAVSCEYLDTEHCPGALAPADRPETTTKWTPRKVSTKGAL